ncbi:hypothetical protein H5410_026934 [Solanum commersonii]|uniref:Uncharacterized protein n=1 Tax=Solanum commersonii TaxID=4109 RepID=A0A9J5YYF7_SOLCO|nr:hypothetical protein H5410_026934 [Solanum commersonii]
MEDVGNKFFQLLLQYSLLQDVKLDEHSNITHCKMHDLVHDLTGDILKSKLFDQKSVKGENLSQINEPRRLYTLFWRCNSVPEDVLLSFKFLRVLNLSKSALPDSICKLYNLQTLKVNNCYYLEELPDEMGNKISLRLIYCQPLHNKHFRMPFNMGKLTCLQTLQYFEVGIEQGRLENLRGELTIRGLQLVANKEEAQITYLQEKPNIYKLVYLWSHDEPEGCETNDEHMLDGLQPHPNLKTLEVEEKIPLLGQLKFLRHLELVGFHKVECIGTTFYAIDGNNNGNIQVFPSLKELVLEDMPSLIEWKGVELILTTNGGRDEVIGVRMFPGFEKLRITKCPLLKCTPNQFEILRELIIEGVDSGIPLLNLCSNLTSLVKLDLSDVKELTCLPDEILRNNVSLQFLSVSDCGEFREFPQSLYNLHSLKSLEISFCTNFSSFSVPSGENYLTSLQSLQLFCCDELTILPRADPHAAVRNCRSLETLLVSYCNNLVSFPLHVWEIPSLSDLDISECPQLISVPAEGLHHLTGLRALLYVYGRLHLDSLPYQLMQLSFLTHIRIYDFGIKAISHTLGNLTSIETLELRSCKRLQHVDLLHVMPKLRYLWIR